MPWPSGAFKYSPRELKEEILLFVLKPLLEAYGLLKEEVGVVNYREDRITSKLVYLLKHKTSVSEMFARHSVHVILWPTEQPGEDISCVPDIKFDLPSRNWLHIEAKRIYQEMHWSVSEYLGSDGIGRILSGKYSIDDPYAGMLCYIQKGDLEAIRVEIKERLLSLNAVAVNDLQEIENCTLSEHNRATGEIIIFHLFLHFA